MGDASEIIAIEKVFGERLKDIHLSATKSMTGHLLGAAGAIEAILAVKSVEEDQIPPTINTTDLDEDINTNVNLTLGKPVSKPVRYAISNTFGFGGHNAIAIFKKWS